MNRDRAASTRRHWWWLAVIACATGVTATARQSAVSDAPGDERYFPMAAWRTDSPDRHGFDPDRLADLLDDVRSRGVPLHHIGIVRHGYLVLSADLYPYRRSMPHDIVSGTKSLTATLIGIAVREGRLGLDDPVARHAGRGLAAPVDSSWEAVTVRHLLTMTSGVCADANDNAVVLDLIRHSPLGVGALLQAPLRARPGGEFVYCDAASQMLSAVIAGATGRTAREYATDRLLVPLGMRLGHWPSDARGDSNGWGDSFWQPHDLLRLGYLYLRQGRWRSQQILDPQWVAEATRAQVATPEGGHYGFQWWVPRPGLIEARGRGGQRLIIWPAHDLVVVLLGAGFDPAAIGAHLERSLRSGPVPRYRNQRLARALARAASPPRPGPVGSIPAGAEEMSGRHYRFEPNEAGLEGFTLTVDAPARGRLTLAMAPAFGEPRGQRTSTVGFDGRDRVSASGRFNLPVAARGRWVDSRTLELVYDEIAAVHVYDIRAAFSLDWSAVRWTMVDRASPVHLDLVARRTP